MSGSYLVPVRQVDYIPTVHSVLKTCRKSFFCGKNYSNYKYLKPTGKGSYLCLSLWKRKGTAWYGRSKNVINNISFIVIYTFRKLSNLVLGYTRRIYVMRIPSYFGYLVRTLIIIRSAYYKNLQKSVLPWHELCDIYGTHAFLFLNFQWNYKMRFALTQ